MTAADGLTLLASSAAKAVVILVCGSIAAAACRRKSASVRHAVWAASFLAVLLLPAAEWLAPPTSLRVPDSAVSRARQWVTIGPQTRSDAPIGVPEAQHSPVRPETNARASTAGRWVLIIWLTGSVIVLGRLAVDLWKARRLARRARLLNVRLIDEHVRTKVVLAESPEAVTPMAVGIWRSVILVPCAFLANSAQTVRAALTHEQAHVQRRDVLTIVLGRGVCALYWFNPLAWFALRSMRREAEQACDDVVLGSGLSPIEYADVLVSAAATTSTRLTHAGLPMAAAHDLERRLRAILESGAPRDTLAVRHTVALCVAVLTMLGTIGRFAVEAAAPPRAAAVVVEPIDNPSSPARHQPTPDPLPATKSPQRASGALEGPDAGLARLLMVATAQPPKHDFDFVAVRARWALEQVKQGHLVPPLIALLHSGDDREAEHAAWALSHDDRPHVLSALVAAMAHPSWRVRANAAVGLARFAPPGALDVMRDALDDPAWQVRMEAATYFAERGDATARGSLESLRRDPHAGVRAHVEMLLVAAQGRYP